MIQNPLCETLKMDQDRRPTIHKMLNLTLEILYLLTGENYITFKLSDGWVAPKMQKPTMEPPSHTLQRNNDKKLLEVTQKMMELLTGEVPRRCQDVSVSLALENSQSSAGHQDLYKEVVVENYPTLDIHDVLYSPGPSRGLPSTNDSSNGQVNETGFIITINRQEVSAAVDADIRACSEDCLDRVVSAQDGNAVANIYNDHGYTAVYSKEVLLSMENGKVATIYVPPEDITYISDEVTEISVTCDDGLPANSLYAPHSEHQEPLLEEDNTKLRDEVPLPVNNAMSNLCNAKSTGSRKRAAQLKVEDGLHRKLELGQEGFPCPQCGKRFSSRSLLTRHTRIHTGLKPFACLECNRCFNRVENLAVHTRIHKGEKPFSCPCGRVFLRKESLVLHKRAHTGEKPFSCADCQKSFTNSSDLVRHRRIHLSQKPFLCSDCGKCFTNKGDLGRHQKTHQDKILPCPHCKRRFAAKSDLLRHLRRHQIPPLSCPCPECGKQFPSKSELARHEVTHSGEKPFECSECGKRFNRTYNLDAHKKTHLGEKPFPCAECGKRFLRKSQLTLHERTHTGEKPYSCSDCGKSFAGSSDLIKHQRLHTGEKPYACDRCDRRFTNKPDLTKHCRVHGKEESFRCSRCKECFPDISALLTHQKTHQERPFCCMVCARLFSSNMDLVNHQRVHLEEAPFMCSEEPP